MRTEINTNGKKILIIGAGKSGVAAAGLLKKCAIAFDLYDSNKDLNIEELIANNPELKGESIIKGEMPLDACEKYSHAVLSPGVPTDLPDVLKLKDAGVKIWGEIELAYVCGAGDVLGITGTNGKTTTTTLTGEIIKAHFKNVIVAGNIGTPYTSEVFGIPSDTVSVLELSSFQLETVESFYPKVSAILNITPDHLNRHHTMEGYVRAKYNIAKNQTKSDVCVLNYEDVYLREFADECPAKVIFFSSKRKMTDGMYLDGENIVLNKDGKDEILLNVNELNILGAHNYENVMAASLVALSYGVPLDTIKKVCREFVAVEHRIEFTAEVNGVKYYNDSKGTNPDAAIKGICAMDRPTYLIGGGYDKQSEYDEWVECFEGRVKKLVLIGTTKQKIADCCEKHGFKEYIFAETLEEAINFCHDNAAPGEAVLLSPACASWDMFKSYEQRGELFKEQVRNYLK